MTASLLSIKPETEDRSSLYYGRFKYRVTFVITGASRTNYAYTLKKFRERIDLDRVFYESQMKRTNDLRLIEDAKHNINKLNTINITEIECLLDFKNRHKRKIDGKFQVQITNNYNTDKVSVYTNNIDIINDAVSLYFNDTKVTQVNLCIPQDVKVFIKPPKYQFRVYMKNKMITQTFKDSLHQFTRQYPEFKLSPSFSRWSHMSVKNWAGAYLQQNYFIEFDGESNYAILLLFFDGYISGYYRLEQRVS